MVPFHVDFNRIGGSAARARHGFSVAPGVPVARQKPAPTITPPPMRLGEGRISSPELSQSEVEAIRSALIPVVEMLADEIEVIKYDAAQVYPETLRSSPDLYKSIDSIGPYLTPQEIRSQMILEGKAIEAEVKRVISGAAASYLRDTDRATLERVRADAGRLVAYLGQLETSPITGAASKLSQDRIADRTENIRLGIEAVERQIVSGEAGSVPVYEPSEKVGVAGILVILGIVVGAGVIIADSI